MSLTAWWVCALRVYGASALAFAALKLTGVAIEWSWWWIDLPIVPLAALAVGGVVGLAQTVWFAAGL